MAVVPKPENTKHSTLLLIEKNCSWIGHFLHTILLRTSRCFQILMTRFAQVYYTHPIVNCALFFIWCTNPEESSNNYCNDSYIVLVGCDWWALHLSFLWLSQNTIKKIKNEKCNRTGQSEGKLFEKSIWLFSKNQELPSFSFALTKQ